MTVLITGGGGFIGAAVTRMLLKQGTKKPVLFQRSAAPKSLVDVAGEITLVQGDLGNFSRVLSAVEKYRPRTIYHLGAMLSVPSEADPAASIQTNVMGTYHILEAARLFGVSQVIFAGSVGAYGSDIQTDVIDDYTLQRPQLLYGATKVFGEHLGLFYKRKYGLDFRGLRYPSIVGPGVTTPGVVQFTSWVIEECAKGNPFTIALKPETRIPVMYYKDAARATIQVAEAPINSIKTVNYLIAGPKPVTSARELADMVRAKIPGAQITFEPNLAIQALVDTLIRPLDDSKARAEWGWQPEYNQQQIIDDFLRELGV